MTICRPIRRRRRLPERFESEEAAIDRYNEGVDRRPREELFDDPDEQEQED